MENPIETYGLALLIVVTLAVAYRLSLAIWPYTACGGCGGSGRNGGSNRSRWGNCRRCGGSGRKLRLGVILFVRNRER